MIRSGLARRSAGAIGAVLLALGVAVAAAVPAGAATPAPNADYQFHHSLASSVAGAPNLQHIHPAGNNTFVGAGANAYLRFPEGNGLRLPNAISVMGRGSYTIAMRVQVADVDSYGRLVNFKPDSSPYSDYGFYVVRKDLRFYDIAEGQNDAMTANRWTTVVLTRTASGVLRAYVDGVRQFGVNDPDGYGKLGGNNVLRFFRDDGNDEETAGAVRRIRIWDRPLTEAQVAAL